MPQFHHACAINVLNTCSGYVIMVTDDKITERNKTVAYLQSKVTCREIVSPPGIVDEAATREKYRQLTLRLIEDGRTITTMESCTSGQVASLITDTEGASAVMPGAFVTYSNAAKVRMGVPAETIETFGVYSAQTASAMARACRENLGTDIGVGVTGTFGNVDPNNADSAPGEVYFAIDAADETTVWHCAVPAQPSRLAYKLYMADVIADRVLALYDK